jgi:hypothetical protein
MSSSKRLVESQERVEGLRTGVESRLRRERTVKVTKRCSRVGSKDVSAKQACWALWNGLDVE